MGATPASRPTEVTVESMPNIAELVAIDALLSHLDPEPAPCGVPGCLHLHGRLDIREDVTAIAA
jgi:hypothetical protein